MSNRVVQLKITGRVQGVGFRYSMLNEAQKLGVAGWVRNNRDGSVEAILQGSESAVEKLIAWAEQGPMLSEVDHVEVMEAAGEFHGFRIEATL